VNSLPNILMQTQPLRACLDGFGLMHYAWNNL
jgi:hypothetical protein